MFLVNSVKWCPSTILHGVPFQFLIQSLSLHLFFVKMGPLHVDYHWEILTNFCHFCWLDYCLFFILSHIRIWFTLLEIMGSFQLSFLCSACLFIKLILFLCGPVTEISSVAYSIPLVFSAVLAWWSGTPSVVFVLKCPYFFSNSEEHLTCIVVFPGNYLLLRLEIRHFMTSWFRVFWWYSGTLPL